MNVGLPYWLFAIVLAGFENLNVVKGTAKIGEIVLIEGTFIIFASILIRWADAYEPEPAEWFLWALVFGAGISIGIAKMGYSTKSLENLSTYGAAFLEEASKVLVLVLPFRKRMINSWTDGFVYGSLAGLGFSFSEDLLYASDSEDGVGLVIYRDINSILAHSLFAGVVGALMIAGFRQRRYLLCGIALPVGALLHGSWNYIVASSLSESTIVLSFMTPAGYIATALALRDFERRQIFGLVQLGVRAGELNEVEARRLWNLRQRRLDRQNLPSHQRALFDRQISISLSRLLK